MTPEKEQKKIKYIREQRIAKYLTNIDGLKSNIKRGITIKSISAPESPPTIITLPHTPV